ncbi:SMP protein, partial [Turnix velox]|nr:SMP protein [Turnix velox]
GSRVELNCLAEGRPPPLISWFRGDLGGGGGGGAETLLREEPVATSLELVWDQVTAGDAGIYSCVAENRHGRHHRTIQLHVA